MCISGVQGGDQPFVVLGTVFVKNTYVVLEYGEKGLRVGLGLRAGLEV